MQIKILKTFVMWVFGAFGYGLIEIIFRGYTHISMGILGGLCLISMSLLNTLLGDTFPLIFKMIIFSFLITILEFLTGLIVNIWLNLCVWDYSFIPANLFGQVCLPFSVCWFFLSPVGLILVNFIKFRIFKETQAYNSIFVRKAKLIESNETF